MKDMIKADWGQSIEATIRAIAAVAVVAYVAGYSLGEAVHRLNDWLAAWAHPHTLTGATGLKISTAEESSVVGPEVPTVKPGLTIQNSAVSIVALLFSDGWSQRRISRHLGISRRQVRSALA